VCGVGLGGRASELQRTSGGHRIKCALRNRSLCVYCNNNNNMVGRCVPVSPARLPAALVAASGRQRRRDGTYFDPSTSDGSFAAGHTNTHTHNTPCPAPNRAWRGAFEWRGVRLLFVLGIYYLISLCGRLSGRLKHCSKGSQMHTHTYTRTAQVVWWWCESVQATRTKTMYRERERERIDRDRSISVCLSVCL
jgi:hypothetical protein